MMESLGARILVADDEPVVTRLLERLLLHEGYSVEVVHDGTAVLETMTATPPDVVLLDVVMPGLDGLEVCRRLKRDPATRLLPVIVVTGLGDQDSRVAGYEAGADEFLTKPIDPQELLARMRSLVRLKRYTDDLDSATAIITTLAVMIEARDGYSEGHCHRMANYARMLGHRIGLDGDDLQTLHRGGFLHDIGMLAIPDSVLHKPGPLEPEEYELIKSHTVIGDRLCGNLRSLHAVRPIVRHHHERLDGSGYPDRLRGDAVPLLAQIIGVVDCYEAVTSQRPHRGAQPSGDALELLRTQVDAGWRRRDLVEEFTAIIEGGGLDTFGAADRRPSRDQGRR